MLDRLYDAWVPRFEDAARRAFEQDRRAVLALLGEAKGVAVRSKATVNYGTVAQEVRSELLDRASARWRSAFLPVLTGMAEATGDAWASGVYGIEWDVRNPRAEQWFRDYELQFAQPILTTTADDLSALLEQAQREGWSIPTTQRHTETLFEQYMNGGLAPEDFAWFEQRMPAHRTELIARTELIRSSNAGSHSLFRDWGAQQKEWMSARDERTRPEHSAADGQVVPIDAHFLVGGYPMQYPGDPNAPLSQTAQCRCALAPVLGEEQELRSPLPDEVAPPPAPELTPTIVPPPPAPSAGRRIREAILSEADALDAQRADVARRYRERIRQNGELYNAGQVDAYRAGLKEVEELSRVREALRFDAVRGYRKLLYQEPASVEALGAPTENDAATYKPWKDGWSAFRRLVGPNRFRAGERIEYLSTPGRAYYTDMGGRPPMVHLDTSDTTRTVVHELGHWLENRGKTMTRSGRTVMAHRVVRSFYNHRTASEPSRRLRDIFPERGYEDHESAKADGFMHAYMGKEYPDGTTNSEILSMSLEQLWRDAADFARKDPEMFEFVVDVLQGTVDDQWAP